MGEEQDPYIAEKGQEAKNKKSISPPKKSKPRRKTVKHTVTMSPDKIGEIVPKANGGMSKRKPSEDTLIKRTSILSNEE